MTQSPQSAAVVRDLLAGKQISSGNVILGPLDSDTTKLLQVMTDNYSDLSAARGEAQARALRTTFVAVPEVTTSNPTTPSDPTMPSEAESSPQREWRLQSLSCESIRGVAPPGKRFSFIFNNLPNLIYGPNGSGKSSLLSAVVWVLTGQVVTDSADGSMAASLFETSDGAKVGKKLCDWPVITTLPAAPPTKDTSTNCWALVVLQDVKTADRLYLRRKSQDTLEASVDGTKWTAAKHLESLGIASLDIQLSLIAPTVFGRRTIEEADDTRHILSLMLGFDDLEKLGDMASLVSGNRTRLANQEGKQLDQLQNAVVQDLQHVEEKLPPALPVRNVVQGLRTKSQLTTAQINAARDQLLAEVKLAETQLAATLGLNLGQDSSNGTLADHLTVAVATLGKGVTENCPSFSALTINQILSPSNDMIPAEQAGKIRDVFNTFISAVCVDIANRYEWWLRETEPGSKAGLLLMAAKTFNEEQPACPVCERPIDDETLVATLRSLKSLDTNLGKELQDFFTRLSDALKAVVPASVRVLSEKTPEERLLSDWQIIRDTTLGKLFGTVTDKFNNRLSAIAQASRIVSVASIGVLPAECHESFSKAAAAFVSEVHNAARALEIVEWSVTNYGAIESQVVELLFVDGPGKTSLLSELGRGKSAAAAITPLVAAARDLAKLSTEQQKCDTLRKDLATLEQLTTPIDVLKQLAKYAENEVAQVFDRIHDRTLANLRHMYPGSGSGMRPSRLQIGKGRDKTVEAYLLGEQYEVPAQHFANAGLQRAIALAFYFALLDQHPMGLGFVLMDDPILSLDEDHRERWSDRILRPILPRVQVILATHQRQFMRHCCHDFSAGVVVELNPRDRKKAISWRPGKRLDRAHQLLSSDHTEAARSMRLYREEILVSLDAYSPTEFFDAGNLAASFEKYSKFSDPHPLAGRAQGRLVACLVHPKVAEVLDPASHHMTEADVTHPMAEDCLAEMRKCEALVRNELDRLDKLRVRSLRDATIAVSVVPFSTLSDQVAWADPLDVPVIGHAAAKSIGWSVDFQDDQQTMQFPPGAAVAVSSNAIEPVARFRQWVMLAEEAAMPHDGDIVAARDADGNCYLRRVWSDSREWILQSVNPVQELPVVVSPKRATGIRTVIGVLYEPLASVTHRSTGIHEWSPCNSFNPSWLAKYRAIQVKGSSLDPIARDGQRVLVDHQAATISDVEDGSLVVVETDEQGVGHLIKRIFREPNACIFISPNPVDAIPPITLQLTAIRAIWPLRGVFFETR